ncbi:hypothetical protein IX317_000369 [Fusobacterium sp. DD29]|uniref:hypothetical protein n=1 Tax=unclassified Fusobacterium TaxID=2648384 RepID=UPI001B8BA3E3|nr:MULTISPECIES: hypothetical protein [unclassified Fusobacterium]MBR8775265.1 hypothetical protein [Fusobacterium sp. DD17]MBR8748710.1 hypothetical protein [Fusobacterium sp. DD29]MBR8760938.1 hypothetical protein [Fusobacterium sp. DD25]MBR8766989.1 hypothetical protein [Fusobacterium sp. DD43]MBR8770990.1 hypothetical protein [Fusobacterium sp. DD40]
MLETIISVLTEHNIISAVSFGFVGIFFMHSRKQMDVLVKLHENSIKEIKEAYSESMNTLKEFIEGQNEKQTKDKK